MTTEDDYNLQEDIGDEDGLEKKIVAFVQKAYDLDEEQPEVALSYLKQATRLYGNQRRYSKETDILLCNALYSFFKKYPHEPQAYQPEISELD